MRGALSLQIGAGGGGGAPGWALRDVAGNYPLWAVDVGENRGWYDGADYSITALLAASNGADVSGAYTLGPYVDTSVDYMVNGDLSSADLSMYAATGLASLAVVSGELRVTAGTGAGNGHRQAFADLAGIGMVYQMEGRRGTATQNVSARISQSPTWVSADSAASITGTIMEARQVEGGVDWSTGADETVYAGAANTGSSAQSGLTHYVDNQHFYKAPPIKGTVRGQYGFKLRAKTGILSGVDEALFCLDCNSTRRYWDIVRAAAGNLELRRKSISGSIVTVDLSAIADNTEVELYVGVRRGTNDSRSWFVYRNGVLLDSAEAFSGVPFTRFRVHSSISGIAGWGGDKSRTQVQWFGGVQTRQFGLYASSMAVANRILAVGDSYIGGAFGVTPDAALGAARSTVVVNIGVGGSELEDQVGYVEDSAYANDLDLLHWDGSDNGWVSQDDTLFKLAQIVATRRTGRFVLIAPNAIAQTTEAGDKQAALYAAMLAEYGASRVHNAQVSFAAIADGSPADNAAVIGGYCPPSMFNPLDVENIHISQVATDKVMADAAAKFALQ